MRHTAYKFKKTKLLLGALCYDCKLDYDKFPCDMVIQNDLWNIISPSTHRGAGLLCPNCICKRLMKLGLTRVLVTVDTAETIK